jgi:hypothetical protein
MSTADIPADILVAAENALDMLLCNCKEAGDVRQDSIHDIARAIFAERVRATEAERERIAAKADDWADALPTGYAHVFRNFAHTIRTPVHTPSPEGAE